MTIGRVVNVSTGKINKGQIYVSIKNGDVYKYCEVLGDSKAERLVGKIAQAGQIRLAGKVQLWSKFMTKVELARHKAKVDAAASNYAAEQSATHQTMLIEL